MTGRGPVGDLRTQAAASEARAAASESRASGQEALALLYRAVLDLDQRNFGTANDRVQEAARALGRVDAAGLRADAAELEGLRAEIAGTDLRVAENLDQQRAAVLGQARRLDGLLGGR